LIIFDILKGNYKRNSIQSWQEASLLLGLNDYTIKNSDAKINNQINNFIQSKLDSSGNWKVLPKEIDAVILGYAILKTDGIDVKKYKPAFDTLYHLINNLKGNDGTIAYRKHMPNYRYVDTIGFISPFLVRYGLLFNHPEAVELGINQIREFNKYAMFEDQFIPCHAYNVQTRLPSGLFGWGRGLGWYAIGLMDSWKEVPENHLYKAELSEMVIRFAIMAMQFQNDNGSWNWQILNNQSQPDSSITASLAWFLANANIVTDCNNAKEKALNYLMKVTRRNGAIDFSQGDTKGIGVYSQQFDILPFTQGFCLRTLNV
jgi:unsaturated rhamnogalacturonyl hydrolase